MTIETLGRAPNEATLAAQTDTLLSPRSTPPISPNSTGWT
jgi:hypothetical protein